MPRKGFAGAAVPTTLGAAIISTDTTFTIASATGWTFTNAGGPFVVVIDRGTAQEEKILCASIAGTTVTVAAGGRGYDGTTAFGHATGATALHVLDSITIDEANAHANLTTRDDHTQYLRTDGTRASTGAQVFGAQVTAQGGVLVSGGPTGYFAGEVQFPYTGAVAIAGQGAAITTLNTGAVGMFFDHRGAGNTGEWRWRNGTNAGVTQMTLSATGVLSFAAMNLAANGGIIDTSSTQVRFYSGTAGVSAWINFPAGITLNSLTTAMLGIDIPPGGSVSGYTGGQLRFDPAQAVNGAEHGISTNSLGAPRLSFHHRSLNNIGDFVWANGTGAGVNLMQLTAGAALGFFGNGSQTSYIPAGTFAIGYDTAQFNIWDNVGGKGFRIYDKVNSWNKLLMDGGTNDLHLYGAGAEKIRLEVSQARLYTFGDISGIGGANTAGSARFLVGLRSDVTGNADDLAIYTYTGGVRMFPAGTERFKVIASGDLFAMGDNSYLGANAFGGAGGRFRMYAPAGDPTNIYIITESSGANTNLILRPKGTGQLVFEDGASNQMFATRTAWSAVGSGEAGVNIFWNNAGTQNVNAMKVGTALGAAANGVPTGGRILYI